MKCHGCDGKGWVDSKHKGPCQCPICKGVGQVSKPSTSPPGAKIPVVPANKYDQDAIWTNLREELPGKFEEKFKQQADRLVAKVKDDKPHEIILHLLFDTPITPQGNLIFHHLQQQTITGPPASKLSRDEILSRGYVPNKDGGVVTYCGIPVGPVYDAMYHWLDNCEDLLVAKLDPNRKGDPLFCDEDMMAIILVPKDIKKLHSIISDMIDFIHASHEVGTVNLSLYLLS